jgi:hypothetical protein
MFFKFSGVPVVAGDASRNQLTSEKARNRLLRAPLTFDSSRSSVRMPLHSAVVLVDIRVVWPSWPMTHLP